MKEELAHAYYSRKTVVIGIKVCITNDADNKMFIFELRHVKTWLFVRVKIRVVDRCTGRCMSETLMTGLSDDAAQCKT